MQKPPSNRAFTLIELMLAIAIAITVTVVAVPNLRGMSRERRLLETFEKFDTFARKAQLYAVRDQRPWSLVWQQGQVVLQQNDPTPEEVQNGGDAQRESFPVAENEVLTVERHASLLAVKETPGVWTFWRSGTCEPVIVSYAGPDGTWSAQYNALTGHGEITDQTVK